MIRSNKITKPYSAKVLRQIIREREDRVTCRAITAEVNGNARRIYAESLNCCGNTVVSGGFRAYDPGSEV